MIFNVTLGISTPFVVQTPNLEEILLSSIKSTTQNLDALAVVVGEISNHKLRSNLAFFLTLSITKSCLCIMISLIFLFLEGICLRLFHYENSSRAFYHCLVLLPFTFTNNFINFNYNFFWYFREYLKQKTQPRKKILNSRNVMFTEDFNHHMFSGPTNVFWVQGEVLNRDHFKVYGKVGFSSCFMSFLLTIPALSTLELFSMRKCSM